MNSNIEKKLIQNVEERLQAPNLGTYKKFININGSNLILNTNQNYHLSYKLPEPLKLDIGDKVTLYQAFVNESGLDSETITFQNDIYEEMKFMYYVPSQNFQGLNNDFIDTGKQGNQGEHTFTSKTDDKTNLQLSDYVEMVSFPNPLHFAYDSTHAISSENEGSQTFQEAFETNLNAIGVTNEIGGDTGIPHYLFELYYKNHPVKDRRALIIQIQKIIYIIPKIGIYSVKLIH